MSGEPIPPTISHPDRVVAAPKAAAICLAELPTIDPAHYAVGGEIARGGMGRIRQARDTRTGREVAIKELLERNPTSRARFEREARVAANLQHPGIVPIYEVGRWPDGTPFFAMRWVQGRTLRQAMHEAPSLEARLRLLPRVIAALEAVAFAHSRNIIHRDLTPNNILVGDHGETIVIDWGLAKEMSEEEPRFLTSTAPALDPYRALDRTLTAAGTIMGTAAYMAPEQARGDVVDKRADVYAAGAILYQLVTGTARRLDDPMLVDPRELSSIIRKAMMPNRDARYSDVASLVVDLRRLTTGSEVDAHDYAIRERIARWTRRRSRWLVAVALSALLIAVGAFASSGVGVVTVREPSNTATMTEPGQPDAPRAKEVAALVSHDYATPWLLRVDVVDERPGLVVWSRSFGDIPVLSPIKSVKVGAHWENRYVHDKEQPPRFTNEGLLSESKAASIVHLDQQLRDGKFKYRVVYLPVLKQAVFKPGSTNAMDYDYVIDGYRIAIEATDSRGEGAWIDAYTGALIQRRTNVIVD